MRPRNSLVALLKTLIMFPPCAYGNRRRSFGQECSEERQRFFRAISFDDDKYTASIMEQTEPIEPPVDVELRYNTVKGPKGKLEVISTVAENGREDLPYLYFIPGWWGRASDYIPVFKYFNGLGFRCRALSFRGTGASEGNSFWGHGFEHDLVPVLHYFADARIVLVPHSGAIDPVRHALPILHETGFTSRIKAIIAIAPLARSGAFPALVRFLKPDKSGTTLARWMRFLGSNVRGLSWFMKNELAIRRVL